MRRTILLVAVGALVVLASLDADATSARDGSTRMPRTLVPAAQSLVVVMNARAPRPPKKTTVMTSDDPWSRPGAEREPLPVAAKIDAWDPWSGEAIVDARQRLALDETDPWK